MKLDIEGHEAEVLSAGADFFQSVEPDAVLFESNDLSLPFWERPPTRLISSFGYRILELVPRVLRPRLREVTTGDEVTGNDFLALRSGVALKD